MVMDSTEYQEVYMHLAMRTVVGLLCLFPILSRGDIEQNVVSSSENLPVPEAGTTIQPPPSSAIVPGGQFGNGVSLGLAEGLVRIAQGENWIMLLNPRVVGGDHEQYGWGLVFRRRGLSNIRQTLYARYEVRHTSGDQWLSTAVGGLEHRAPGWTGRLRGYHSPHGVRVIEEWVEKERQRLRDGSIQEVHRFFERREIPLSGAEAEVGVRAPLPPWLGELQLFGGAHLRDGPGLDQENGWLTRLEYRPRNRLLFDVTAYFNRDFSSSDVFYGFSFIIPLGPHSGGLFGNENPDGSDRFWLEPPSFSSFELHVVETSGENVRRQTITTTRPPRRADPQKETENIELPETPVEPHPEP